MRLQRRVQVLELECGTALHIKELVDVPQIFLGELVVIGEGYLPLAPRHIV